MFGELKIFVRDNGRRLTLNRRESVRTDGVSEANCGTDKQTNKQADTETHGDRDKRKDTVDWRLAVVDSERLLNETLLMLLRLLAGYYTLRLS